MATPLLQGLPPFDPDLDVGASVGPQWRTWLADFETFVIANDITDAKRKRALLLYQAGSRVREIFRQLQDTREDKDYQKAVDKLNEYFEPQKNRRYEARMDQTNEILATLMAERKRPPEAHFDGYPYPPTKRVMIDDDLESVASMNAIPRAAQTATFIAAQTANFRAAEAENSQAAQAANFQPAQTETPDESTETQVTHTQRSSEDDVLSLYGGK
eukprot:gene4155-4710_t